MMLKFALKRPIVILLSALVFLFSVKVSGGDNNKQKKDPPLTKSTHRTAGNPYLPLWEHLPDGEPRVFEDPDKPGKYRIYII